MRRDLSSGHFQWGVHSESAFGQLKEDYSWSFPFGFCYGLEHGIGARDQYRRIYWAAWTLTTGFLLSLEIFLYEKSSNLSGSSVISRLSLLCWEFILFWKRRWCSLEVCLVSSFQMGINSALEWGAHLSFWLTDNFLTCLHFWPVASHLGYHCGVDTSMRFLFSSLGGSARLYFYYSDWYFLFRILRSRK